MFANSHVLQTLTQRNSTSLMQQQVATAGSAQNRHVETSLPDLATPSLLVTSTRTGRQEV